MFCTKCGHANRDTAKFCAQCGTALGRRIATAPDATAADSQPKPQAPAPVSKPVPDAAMTPHAEVTSAAATTQTDTDAAASAAPLSANSNSRNAIVLGSVVLVCVLAAAATWILTRKQTTEAPVAAEAAPPQSAAAAIPDTAAEAASGVPVPDSLPPAPGMPAKPAAEKPVVLSEAEVQRLVARLQQEPSPFSCQAAAQRIRKDNNTGPAQAMNISKRAWPQLCAPESIAAAAALPPPESRTIDQLYEERAAAECAKGLSGLLCREALHIKLCNGRWSANPPPGQSRCYQAGNDGY